MKQVICKRSICLFMVILMSAIILISFPMKADAANNTNELIFETIYMESIDEGADDNPFEDISNIKIGNVIPSYCIRNGYAVETSAEYVPIFDGNQLISFAIITYSKSKVSSIELTDELVDEISDYQSDDIALIFDNISTYILYKNELILIKSYDDAITIDPEKEDEYKDSIAHLNSDAIQKIDTDEFLPVADFALSETKKAGLENSIINSASVVDTNDTSESTLSYPTSKYLSVSIVPQNGLPICWAAAVAGIGKYKTGISHSAEYVSDYIYGQNQGGNTYIALLALGMIYDLDGADIYSAPSFNIIQDSIYNSNPMYVRLYGSSSSSTVNHALVFIGYYDYTSGTYDGKIRYNDSNATSYKTVYFTTDGSYCITYNGVTCYVDQYILLS